MPASDTIALHFEAEPSGLSMKWGRDDLARLTLPLGPQET